MEVVPCSSKDDVKLLLQNTNDHYRVFVEDENAAHRVENYQMNSLMRKLVEREAVAKFTDKDGYVRINKDDHGKYELVAKVRGNGGTGPITAFTAGMIVRVGCYTGYLLGVTAPAAVGTAIAGPMGGAAGVAATGLVLTQVAAAGGVIAGTEALAMKVTLATLLFPFPLP